MAAAASCGSLGRAAGAGALQRAPWRGSACAAPARAARCISAEAAAGKHVAVAGCGAAGASTAMHLARLGARVTVLDPRPPLTATSQYSTECYRNFFMDPPLVSLMSRSIDLLEELAGDENLIGLGRRGYCFLSATEGGGAALEAFAEAASHFGGGPVRKHHRASASGGYVRSPVRGFRGPGLDGFDLLVGSDAIREVFPFVSEKATAMLHARRCGWLDPRALGKRCSRRPGLRDQSCE
ncbi:unnamed protein product [Prorocentrum cordatum]|uniref:FAD-dependent oxidoreductase domain-containing protein 1 n=1 Tax=Prorocentrum cordatum TaxID=2364126 RepID=A0ABN9X847_9DINO|nr:unnamed protein product [Polarella glacialis]